MVRSRLTGAVCALAALLSLSAGVEDADIGDPVKNVDLTRPTVMKNISPNVVTVTNETFYDVIEKSENIMIEFYANWCSICKSTMSEYSRAADLAKELGMPLTVARIDADKYSEFAESLNVSSLPTILLFGDHGSRASEFPVLTTSEAMLSGAANLLGLTQFDIVPAKELSGDPMDAARWLFWRGWSDGRLRTTLTLYAPSKLTGEAAERAAALEATFVPAIKFLQRYSNLRFAIVREESVMEFFDLDTSVPSIVLYIDHDETRVEFKGELTEEALVNFVLAYDTPLVVDVDHRSMRSYRSRVNYFGLYFLNESQFEHPPTLERTRRELRDVMFGLESKGLFKRGEVTLAVTNGHKYKAWMAHFGLKTGVFPALAVERTTDGAVFNVPDFSEEAAQGCPTDSPMYKPAGAPDVVAEVGVGVDGSADSVPPTAPTASPVDEDGIVPYRGPVVTWSRVPEATVASQLELIFSGFMPPVRVDKQAAAEVAAIRERQRQHREQGRTKTVEAVAAAAAAAKSEMAQSA